MPRDPNGVYSLPVGYRATDGEAAIASQHNPPLEDLASAMTDSLPRNGSAPMLADLDMGGNKVTDVATGAASTDAVNKAQMDAAILAAALAPGVVAPYAGSSAPSGWLLCNGQAVSRTTYSALFAIIATTYGTGDGSTTFNVPDLRGEFLRGLDGGRGVDSGRTLGSAQSADIAAHNHTASATSTVTDPGHDHTIRVPDIGYPLNTGSISSRGASTATTTNTVNVSGTMNTAATGISVATSVTVNNSTGTETRPRNIALNFIIKT